MLARSIAIAMFVSLSLAAPCNAQWPSYYNGYVGYGDYPTPNYAYSFGTTYRYVPNVGYRPRVTPFVYPPYPAYQQSVYIQQNAPSVNFWFGR